VSAALDDFQRTTSLPFALVTATFVSRGAVAS